MESRTLEHPAGTRPTSSWRAMTLMTLSASWGCTLPITEVAKLGCKARKATDALERCWVTAQLPPARAAGASPVRLRTPPCLASPVTGELSAAGEQCAAEPSGAHRLEHDAAPMLDLAQQTAGGATRRSPRRPPGRISGDLDPSVWPQRRSGARRPHIHPPARCARCCAVSLPACVPATDSRPRARCAG